MKLIGKSLVVGLAAAAVAIAACSTTPHSSPSGTGTITGQPGPSSDSIGALGMNLTLPGNEHFSKLTYTLTNGTNALTGSYDISKTVTLSFVIGSVPAGMGYSLQLSTTSDDGTVICSFPAQGDPLVSNITVVARTTTVVNVNMQCTTNSDAGNVLVNARPLTCPVWNTIVANPLNITLDGGQNVNDSGTFGTTAVYMGPAPQAASILDGQQLVLVGSAIFPDPTQQLFTWTTTGGTLSSANGTIDPNSNDAGVTDQTIFTCPGSPSPTTTFTVTMTVSDGTQPDGGVCDAKFSTGTVQVTCSNPGICGGAPFATTAGGACTLNGMPAGNDSKGFPFVTGGSTDTGPDGGTVFCCVGACNDTGPIASPFPGGSCAEAGAGFVNNGQGCCVGLQACTATGQANCVYCQGNGTPSDDAGLKGVCSATEALFVNDDIKTGKVTAPGADTNGGSGPTDTCYNCLFAKGCLDDTVLGDHGHECADLNGGNSTANFTAGNGSVGTYANDCTATISCIIADNAVEPDGGTAGCATFNGGIDNCYCGPGGGSPSACGTSTSGQNGSCFTQETNGLSAMPNSGSGVLGQFTNTSFPSGMANQIFVCATGGSASTQCTQCLQ